MSESFDGYTLNCIVRDILNSISLELEDIFLEKLKYYSFNNLLV